MTSLEIILVSSLTITAYQSVPAQTDSSPFITSIGHRTTPYTLAVSQDLLASHEVCYNDVVNINGLGLKIVQDTMNKRIKRSMDVWVRNKQEEKAIGVRKNQFVLVIKSPKRVCR